MSRPHLLPLGDTGWFVWRDALLRTTGFPAAGLARFTAPECAQAADADSDEARRSPSTRQHFADVFAATLADASRQWSALAADPLFREAVTLQNTNALTALDSLVRHGPDERRHSKRRVREEMVARYWQRYCAKNETISFFGPSCWVRIDPNQPAAAVVRPGPGLVRQRDTFIEHWAWVALAETLAQDPEIREWLPPFLHPHLTLDGERVRRPALPPMPVSATEAELISRCDGVRSARDIMADLVAAGRLRRPEDGLLILERLVERDILRWSPDPPMHPSAEDELIRQLARCDDDKIRARAMAPVDRLRAARDRVAAAAGDPDALLSALTSLDTEFVELTGEPPRRRAGQMYAGRALSYEDAVRDLDVVFGAPVLEAIAAPLSLLLRAARWLTAELARAYMTGLRALYQDLLADGEPVWLGDLWYLAQGLLFGKVGRPADPVVEEFSRRWSTLFGLADAGDRSRLDLASADLIEAANAAFPAKRPGWSLGHLHSPDIQVCAADVDELNRGEFFLVLSELHAAWPTFDCTIFIQQNPDASRLVEAMHADLGPRRIRPLYPPDWLRMTGRIMHALDHPSDRLLGFAPAAGATQASVLPVTSVTVTEVDGELIATASDATTWPLIEVFSWLISIHSLDAFKLSAAAAHTPRITVDRMVLARETWRTTIEETGLAGVIGDERRYRAVRAWRQAMGLPDRVFVKFGSETKPFYVDLTSPTYVSALCSTLRSAAERIGSDVTMSISEMLPAADLAWVPDAEGRRYFSELRLQVFDPAGTELA